MKAALRLPLGFLCWFVTIVCVTGLLLAAHGYVSGYAPGATSETARGLTGTGAFRAGALLAGVSLVWVPAVLIAAVLALFAATRGDPPRATSMLALVCTWTLVLVAGGLLAGVVSARPPARSVIPERRVVRVDSYRLYLLPHEAGTGSVLLVHDERRDPGFTVVADAVLPLDRLPEFSTDDHAGPILSRAAGSFPASYPAMVRQPGWTDSLRADIAETARLLAVAGPGGLSAMLNLLALSLFLFGCWTLVRLTRWPLFNVAAALAALRLALWLVPASQTGMLRPMLIAAFDSRALPVASAAVLAALGIGLSAILVFLPPAAEWKREVHGG